MTQDKHTVLEVSVMVTMPVVVLGDEWTARDVKFVVGVMLNDLVESEAIWGYEVIRWGYTSTYTETSDPIAPEMGDPDEYGTCDICDEPYLLGGDDHNAETGNHYECEGIDNPPISGDTM